ncbi:zinc dependent phospholipase C family protein [Sphingobacterium sp.]|uniref:zinc dependent phospholipase C family protein n=1 Tax=Sphingobacterium sp. TaxID=341027 RepID=UPI00289F0B7C|nr:zinc dependent phospholipase C family protein [Sphingobacterium sp.]
MTKSPLLWILSIVILLTLNSWGFFAHKKINHYAVFALPAKLAKFYKSNIDLITEKAVDPDKRCFIDSAEGPRHFIDIEDYREDRLIDSIPVHWSQAKEKFQERQLLKNGIIPWQINFTYLKLVKAFKSKDYNKIIKHSADLGHYIADAHVPLHTTKNYNGQLTGQIGIHAFWESRLPEMFAGEYNLLVGKAIYIEDPLSEAWTIVRESNQLVDSVLRIESLLNKQFKASQKNSFIERNNQLLWTYSDSYAKAYHLALNGMVERRMRKTILRVASYWHSAWLESGQPDLSTATKIKTENKQDSINIEDKKPIGREEWM